MPSLEDIPHLVRKTSPSGSDLVSIYDVSEGSNSRVKAATAVQLVTAAVAALPGPYDDDTFAAAAGVTIGKLYLNAAFGPTLIAIRRS